MIIQRAVIRRHTTEDGLWEVKGGETLIGKDQWVIPARIAMIRTLNSDKKAATLRIMIALAESPADGVPVELLEFTNDFRAVPDH